MHLWTHVVISHFIPRRLYGTLQEYVHGRRIDYSSNDRIGGKCLRIVKMWRDAEQVMTNMYVCDSDCDWSRRHLVDNWMRIDVKGAANNVDAVEDADADRNVSGAGCHISAIPIVTITSMSIAITEHIAIAITISIMTANIIAITIGIITNTTDVSRNPNSAKVRQELGKGASKHAVRGNDG